MLFSWLKRRRRRKLLAEPFPVEWLRVLKRNLHAYPQLSQDEQARMRDKLRVLIAEKNWEGCGGLALSDEIKVTIAAYASLLVLNREHEFYDRLISVLVYPDSYMALESNFPLSEPQEVGHREGESWHGGVVVLSWSDIQENIQALDGRNLVLHEFAHQLDSYDRWSDGTPQLDNISQYQAWREIMTEEYSNLVSDARHGRPTLLDTYGTTNEAEFFAVCTECFFELPRDMQRMHPRLYELLCDYFRQDPSART